MKKIILKDGTEVLVSDRDYFWAKNIPWGRTGRNRKYIAFKKRYGEKTQSVFIHRLVMGAFDRDQQVDHINGDPLDNRRENLRFATQSQNQRNRKQRTSTKTGYKGVAFKSKNCWEARIGYMGKALILGCYKTPWDAARAYNEAAVKYHGKFANLNKRLEDA